MFHPIAILGLVLSISGVIAGGYLLFERIFGSTFFNIFLTLTPNLIHTVFPRDPTMVWFTTSINKNIYASWKVALIYFLLLPIVLFVMLGFWVFLILRLCGIYDIGTAWLCIWFIVLCFAYFWSAVNQYAVEVKAKHKRAGAETIIKYIIQDPKMLFKRYSYHFFLNWVQAPFTTFKLLLIVFLFVLLHWPAWLIQICPKIKLDLTNSNTRKYYYIGYMIVTGVSGLTLIFLFK
jgi:hypothetical protein